jgi:hypothetical protein
LFIVMRGTSHVRRKYSVCWPGTGLNALSAARRGSQSPHSPGAVGHRPAGTERITGDLLHRVALVVQRIDVERERVGELAAEVDVQRAAFLAGLQRHLRIGIGVVGRADVRAEVVDVRRIAAVAQRPSPAVVEQHALFADAAAPVERMQRPVAAGAVRTVDRPHRDLPSRTASTRSASRGRW